MFRPTIVVFVIVIKDHYWLCNRKQAREDLPGLFLCHPERSAAESKDLLMQRSFIAVRPEMTGLLCNCCYFFSAS